MRWAEIQLFVCLSIASDATPADPCSRRAPVPDRLSETLTPTFGTPVSRAARIIAPGFPCMCEVLLLHVCCPSCQGLFAPPRPWLTPLSPRCGTVQFRSVVPPPHRELIPTAPSPYLQIQIFLRGIAAMYRTIANMRRITPSAISGYGNPILELVLSTDLKTALDPPDTPTRPHVAFIAGIRCPDIPESFDLPRPTAVSGPQLDKQLGILRSFLLQCAPSLLVMPVPATLMPS